VDFEDGQEFFQRRAGDHRSPAGQTADETQSLKMQDGLIYCGAKDRVGLGQLDFIEQIT
jgi:hypothetical protein